MIEPLMASNIKEILDGAEVIRNCINYSVLCVTITDGLTEWLIELENHIQHIATPLLEAWH